MRSISLQDALRQAAALVVATPVESVGVECCQGRRLAADVTASVDMPPLTSSAMDGFAVRARDTPGTLHVVGESRAGHVWSGSLRPGEALRISTGAAVPAGADAVVRREDATEHDGARVDVPHVQPAHDVRRAGEDLRAGGVVLRAGNVVRPHDVAAIAAAGRAFVECHRPPRVVILASGDELVPPGTPLGPGQVYECNGVGIAAQARAAGATVGAVSTLPDDPGATLDALVHALDGADHGPPDLLITVGGVSVGDHDHLRPAMATAGVEESFWGIRVRPGHPTWLGRAGDRPVLGLPGNPVSAAVIFHVLGRALLGVADLWEERAPLGESYRARGGRAEIPRCRLDGGAVYPLPKQGSHHIAGLAGADALAWIPEEAGELAAGAKVAVSRLG